MTNILIVIDPEETEHSALNRIKEIPVGAGINFKVDFYLSGPPVLASQAGHADIHIKERRAWMDELVKPLTDAGYKITTEIIPFTRLYEEIIRSAAKFQADFVFKPVRQHNALARLFYTSTDWNLIRLCPVPLLMVSDRPSVRGNPVVAGIDVDDGDEAHKQLNEVVLQQADLLSRVLGAPIHVVYAFAPAVIAGRAAATDPLAYEISHDRYEELLARAQGIAEAHGIAADNVHLREGAPELAVSQYAEEVNANVIVLGTVARSGAAGLFIGNTAEGVLERTTSDVFVVKLPGFKTPAR